MQCPHRREAAPQWHAGIDKASTEAGEQLSRRSGQQALAHGPDVQIDDPPAERRVKADREQLGHQLSAALGTRLVEQLLEHLVGLGADDAVTVRHKGRHPGDAVAVRFRPVGVDRILETALG
jgi:hypothetical protein